MTPIELATHTWGESGPPIVLLHGLSSAGGHYENLAPTLVADGWRVIAPDLRGHGDSPRAPGTYMIAEYAADIEALLESIGEAVVLAGHSLGGAIAVYLAGLRPDLVRAAFAEDPPLYHGQPGVMAASGYVPVFTIMRDEMRAAQASDDPEATIRQLLDKLSVGGERWAETVEPATFEARVRSFGSADPDVWDPAIAGDALAGWDPARPVDVPLTILRADPAMGPAFTADEAARFAATHPDAHILEIEGAPHSIRENLATTDRYRFELLNFLDSLR